jgi:hypothetical protein
MTHEEQVGRDGADVRLQLADLKRCMEQDFAPHKLFFFPSLPKEGIAGYWGMGPVVFIAERPSDPQGRESRQHMSSLTDFTRSSNDTTSVMHTSPT